MILISNDFWHQIKMHNFDPYNVLLSISTNIPVLLMTDSVLQRHLLYVQDKFLTSDLFNIYINFMRAVLGI